MLSSAVVAGNDANASEYNNLRTDVINANPVGIVSPWITATAPTGFLLCEGGTIGNAASGGTARANADTVTLYTLLWDAFADAQLAVSGGRGANAAADYAANKTIALPNIKGKTLVGYSSAETEFDANGETGGEKTHVISEAEMAAHTHDSTYYQYVGGSSSALISYNAGQGAATVLTSTSKGSNTAHNNLQPYFTLRYIIRYAN